MLAEYRHAARVTHQKLVQTVECGILEATANSDKLCYGIRERYIAFTRFVYKRGVKLVDTTPDVELIDIKQILQEGFCKLTTTNVDILYTCNKPLAGCKCSYRVNAAIGKALDDIYGNEKRGSLCLDCFVRRVSVLQQSCKEHAPKQPVQDDVNTVQLKDVGIGARQGTK